MSDIIKFNADRDIVAAQNGEIVRECHDLEEMTEEIQILQIIAIYFFYGFIY